MVKYINECVSCGQPCIGLSCMNYSVSHFYCDICGDETQLYEYDGQELCLDCIEQSLTKINLGV